MSREQEMADAYERWEKHGNWQYYIKLTEGRYVIIMASRVEVAKDGTLIAYTAFKGGPEMINCCWAAGHWSGVWLLSAMWGDRSCLIDDSTFWNEKSTSCPEPVALPKAQPKRDPTPEEERRSKERARVRPSVRWRVLQRDSYTCKACGRSKDDGVALHVDHIVAIANGGTSDDENLQTLCFDCNQGKGAA